MKIAASIHPLTGVKASYLVNVFAPSLGTRKAIRAALDGHCLTGEHKPPAMTLEEAEMAREWAIDTYGHLPDFRCCLLDAETHGEVDL